MKINEHKYRTADKASEKNQYLKLALKPILGS